MFVNGNIDWSFETQTVKARLSSIEKAAVAGEISAEVIGEIRSAVDHCRTTLWGATAAITNATQGAAAVLLTARLLRVQEMCDRIVEEVRVGRVWMGTPGLAAFVTTLTATEQCVRTLLEQSAAADKDQR